MGSLIRDKGGDSKLQRVNKNTTKNLFFIPDPRPQNEDKLNIPKVKDDVPSKVKKIYGPPGTGKTTFLLNIVEQELENLTPEDIAFVAYTKKAASEAINRAAYKFKLDQKDFKYFRTIHSLAFQCLGLSTNDVMKSKHYHEISGALKVDLAPKDTHDEDGNFVQQDPYLKIIDLSRITGVGLYDTFSKFGHIVGGWRKLEQIAEYLKEFKKVEVYMTLLTCC